MPTRKTHEVLNVFLASPGDVVSERELAGKVVDGLNRGVEGLGWRIELHRWEENGPAFGRPQGVINPSVDACDLFVGLLWERWGQPTGKYSSGFEEEFERAMARRKSSGDPEIWLVFKKPREDRVADPGDQLKKVLEFCERQRSLRQVLFREVSEPQDWERSFSEWLLKYIVEHAKVSAESVQTLPVSSPRPTAESSDSEAAAVSDMAIGEDSQARSQLVELAAKLARAASIGNLEFARAERGLLQEVDVARIYLLASTLMSRRHTGGFLGTHEINLLYRNRLNFEGTPDEQYQLLRTVVHDQADVAPGWFWFRDAFADGPAEVLLRIASEDQDDQIRESALRLLGSAAVQIPKDLWKAIPIWDDSQAVSSQALKYLAVLADESALAMVEGGAANPASAPAKEARIRILLRIDATRAFTELVSSGIDMPEDLVGTFRDSAEGLKGEDLVKGTDSSADELKKFCVLELLRRGELSVALADRLRQDDSVEVRRAALGVLVKARGIDELERQRQEANSEVKSASLVNLSALLGGGSPKRASIEDVDEVTRSYFRTLDLDELTSSVVWFGRNGVIAYEVVATDHFGDGVTVREDLKTGFQRLMRSYLDELRSRHGDQFVTKFLEELKERKLDDFILSQFTAAALSGLALHSEPRDLELARRHLHDDDQVARLACVRIVARHGDSSDVKSLLALSRTAWGELKELALGTAIQLSAEPQKLAMQLACSKDQVRRDEALRWLTVQDSEEVKGYFKGLLNDESEILREVAIAYLASRLSGNELEVLLQEYGQSSSYYYNVVTWLDRLLYAPADLRGLFRRQLGTKLQL